MKIRALHPWDLSTKEAMAVQDRLRPAVVTEDRLGIVHYVAGIDVGYEDRKRITRAAVCVLSFPELKVVDQALARLPTVFPYVPGLLTFREAPAALKALELLSIIPDLLLYDGHGFAHPRRFGIASHIGLLCDIPSIGVAKTRLIGTHEAVPDQRGAWRPLRHQDETIGAVLCTRNGTNPVFVSIGHRVSLPTAVHFVLACAKRYRLPETTRWAHRLASTEFRVGGKG